jgi:hypothetical protein
VDLEIPRFTAPTEVTNPLHPSAITESVVMLGKEDGVPLRVEVTLLPTPKTIVWNGEAIETLESQYVAYVDGRIKEVALDWYAQADDGGVWYFGEDVFNYEDGVLADTEGTWMAGRDGPPGLIMPAIPRSGAVYRPENIPGLVFEEVTVSSTGETALGPSGLVSGTLEVEEVHQDGAHELKTFAPGYGEFSTGSGDNVEAVAIAVPIDARGEPLPADLSGLVQSTTRLSEFASDNQAAATEIAAAATSAGQSVVKSAPPLLARQMEDALGALGAAVTADDVGAIRRAALDARLAAQDVMLMYLPRQDVDLGRLETAARRASLDAEAGDTGGLSSDTAVLEAIWARVRHATDLAARSEIQTALADLRSAADSPDFEAAGAAAARLIALLSDAPATS